MIIAIIILSILLILSIIYNILFTKGVAKLLSPENIEQRYNLIVDYYEDASNIEESFPCCLLLHLQFNAKESAKITDFSNYYILISTNPDLNAGYLDIQFYPKAHHRLDTRIN